VSRLASYALVLLVGIELALWEAFLVAARPFGTALPLAAAVAVAGNLLLGLAGGRLLRRPLGAALPGVLWLAVALALGTKTAEGDVVVAGTGRGTAFLLAGTAAAAIPVGLTSGRARRAPHGLSQPGATPEPGTRR